MDRITREQIESVCGDYSKRNQSIKGVKVFDSQEYPTLNQVKYQCRRLMKKYQIYTEQQLINELVEDHLVAQTNSI